ncbi:unnamed protein product [Penicillium egyptiacum]|uniref:Uncharacterized protein n=1 Tax=Penicillium egyptiacum TaxID=1303716 RepID=A0A9W4KKR2_9EURO|nr:unnamed protein product [Penicillium egyptiacum]
MTILMFNLESLIFIMYRKENLGMYGNELNCMQTCWTIGYVIGEIPSNILLSRIKPRYWIPAMEIGGLFFMRESCLAEYSLSRNAVYHRLLVPERRVGKRSCIFHTSRGIASMFSGYLMDAVFHLGG